VPRAIVEGIGHRLAAWAERRRTMDELSALTDRDLADIGLTRGDIFRVVAGDEVTSDRHLGYKSPALRPLASGRPAAI
jgi:uncharacterized protein YjiS (DUF1127 family)